MNGSEQQIRQRLGIPADARCVLVIDQSAHMDWDWTSTFLQYFWSAGANAVHQLLSEAVVLLSNNAQLTAKAPDLYYYSVCETGYLQKFVEAQIAQGVDIISKLRAAGNYLHVIGGGITSPDCLLSDGEAFLRNYLVGKLWLAEALPGLLPLRHCWLPDDFGQDPELPVAVKALGMRSIAFSRLPGIPPTNSITNRILEIEMLTSGADFHWVASDRASTVFTHWMPGPVPGYYQGKALAGSNAQTAEVVKAVQSFLSCNNKDFTTFTPPFSAAPTNYVYMPIDDDFMSPIPDLLACVAAWNSSQQTSGVYAVEASYDDFVSLALGSGVPLLSKAYNGTPYFTGYYASRPALKILHYAAARSMLAAEAFGLLASGAGSPDYAGVMIDPLYWRRVRGAWADFVPSTHHDYVCGTAPDSVTFLEQIPLLQTALRESEHAAAQALGALGASLPQNENGIFLANPAGTPFTGLVELPAPVPGDMNSVQIGGNSFPVQGTCDGGLVFSAQVPALGYLSGQLSPDVVKSTSDVSISPAGPGAAAYTLQNEFLTVTVSAAANWGISSILDASGRELLAAGGTGNDLVFYNDSGNIYQFGNEIPDTTFEPATLSVHSSGPGLGGSVTESGPVRVRLRTIVSIGVEGGAPFGNYAREYSLVAGEPFLRMAVTGMAPPGYSVLTAFPMARAITSIDYGTPCHWTAVQPHEFWGAPVFRATHKFLLAKADGEVVAVIYHPEVPAWSFDGDGVLLGCLLRNTPGTQRAASGSDPDVHTLRYAFRVPAGLGDPSTGQPLSEALNYVSPARACLLPAVQGYGNLPARGFIASVTAPGFIQAAKPGDVAPGSLILRIYQPSNKPLTLTVTLGQGKPASVVAVTALEDLIDNGAPQIAITDSGFTIEAVAALNTVQITFTET